MILLEAESNQLNLCVYIYWSTNLHKKEPGNFSKTCHMFPISPQIFLEQDGNLVRFSQARIKLMMQNCVLAVDIQMNLDVLALFRRTSWFVTLHNAKFIGTDWEV